MVSSMGYVVLSGNMQVDRQDTSLFTPYSLLSSMMLSCMKMFFRQNSTLYFCVQEIKL